MDDNPRPQKRLRTDIAASSELNCALLELCPPPSLRPLPPHILLLALPGLLAHPPTHEKYGLSLFLSLKALRACLKLEALTPDIECHAWTALVEVGIRAIDSGFTMNKEHEWSCGLEAEVENAIGKGLLIAQKHPSLRPLRHRLSLLNAHFAFQSCNTRFARALLRRLISSFVSSDPPTIVYAAHLALINQLSSTPPRPLDTSSDSSTSAPTSSTPVHELQAALASLINLSTLAARNQHSAMLKLTAVLRVRMLATTNMWDMVGDSLKTAERELSLLFDDGGDEKGTKEKEKPEPLLRSHSITVQDVHANAVSPSQPQLQVSVESSVNSQPPVSGHSPVSQFTKDTDPLTLTLVAHTLILGILYYTRGGHARSVESRLSALHGLMDSGAPIGGVDWDGHVEIPLPPHDSIYLRVTHPRILFLLTFLISAVAKRDPVGRRPKKKIFAESGVAQCREGIADMNVPSWASLSDVRDIDQQTLKIEADLLCELVAVSIQRCDFDAAEDHLAVVIALTRTHGFFPEYAARITLHNAHLAHAQGNVDRARTCYQVAAYLDGAGPVEANGPLSGGFVAAAARAGEALLRIGLAAGLIIPNISPEPRTTPDGTEECHVPHLDPVTQSFVKDAIARCSSDSSAPLPALAALLSATLSRSQIIRSKALLKEALALSSAAGDNHLRALVLAVVGAQYVYTAPEHAMEVLAVCETLGAGMGASNKRDLARGNDAAAGQGDGVGNAALRLWVGERFLELFKRAGKLNRAQKQEALNARYKSALDKLHGLNLC